MKQMNRQKFAANLTLLLVATIWGSGFIAQKLASDEITALAFNGIRYSIGAVFIFFLAKCRLPFKDPNGPYALLAGVILTFAGLAQQLGFIYTSVANASFITATYIVLVPFFSGFLFRKRVKKACYLAAVMALIGLYFLSTNGEGLERITFGDILVFVGSVFWALHIIVVERAAALGDPVRFSAGQFLVSGLTQMILWLTVGKMDASGLSKPLNWLLIAYSGVIVMGLAFTLQAIAQKRTSGAEASIILGLESVFGTLFAVVLFHERLYPLQILGSVLIMGAVLIATLQD